MRKPQPYKKFIITRKNEETGKTEYLLWVNDGVYLWLSREEYEMGCYTTFFEEMADETIEKFKKSLVLLLENGSDISINYGQKNRDYFFIFCK